MRQIMFLSWLGFTALSAGLLLVAVVLDRSTWPATKCQAKWAHANLATRWRWDTWCQVYSNGAWLTDKTSAATQFQMSHAAE
jgi:hypothetical protein